MTREGRKEWTQFTKRPGAARVDTQFYGRDSCPNNRSQHNELPIEHLNKVMKPVLEAALPIKYFSQHKELPE